jgi:hypothetical protein
VMEPANRPSGLSPEIERELSEANCVRVDEYRPKVKPVSVVVEYGFEKPVIEKLMLYRLEAVFKLIAICTELLATVH